MVQIRQTDGSNSENAHKNIGTPASDWTHEALNSRPGTAEGFGFTEEPSLHRTDRDRRLRVICSSMAIRQLWS